MPACGVRGAAGILDAAKMCSIAAVRQLSIGARGPIMQPVRTFLLGQNRAQTTVTDVCSPATSSVRNGAVSIGSKADLFRSSQVLCSIAVHAPYACTSETLTDGSPRRSLLLLCEAGKAGDEKRAQHPADQLLEIEVVGDRTRKHDSVVLLELYNWQELIQAVDYPRRQTRG